MRIARTITVARAELEELSRPLGLVPTMGALHAGHLSLVAAARQDNRSVAVSLFVNPTQFGAGEDYDRYPRDEARDLSLLEQADVDLVFVPAVEEMFPCDAATLVQVRGPLAERFEAAHRPGHFAGVATVVVKLLHIVCPDRLYLGEKDAQQLAVVRRVVRDLDLPVEVVGVPTVREPDGLAMSSRNVNLDPQARAAAPLLYAALQAAAAAAADGETAIEQAFAAALNGQAAPRFTVDYAAVVDPETFTPAKAEQEALLIAAVRLGGVRLIDNLWLSPRGTSLHVVDGTETRK